VGPRYTHGYLETVSPVARQATIDTSPSPEIIHGSALRSAVHFFRDITPEIARVFQEGLADGLLYLHLAK
jgi:hypothetical protein